MDKKKSVLAFDFGASSGRAMLGKFDGKTIQLEEVHRFSNDPVSVSGTLYWDVLRLFYEIKQGLVKAKLAGGFDSVAVDTWGVDFGLLDREGCLVENPIHYRDGRTAGMMEEAFTQIEKDTFREITGNQFMEINTAFQLLSLAKKRPDILERAETLLLMPDLFSYFLSGEKLTEYSIASTTQLLDARKGAWSQEVLEKLGIPSRLFTKIVPSGTKTGTLSPELRTELGLPAAEVIRVCGHDTQSAVAAVPTSQDDFIFLSCGTWSLLGTELDHPILTRQSAACNLTNEGGINGTTTFLQNIIGLWMIQESRRQWQREGKEYSYADLEKLALSAVPFQSFIDPDSPEFTPPGDIPGRVREFCKKTGQPVPETVGDVMRCIYQSLALKYRFACGQIELCTGKSCETLHVVGGGAKDGLLCRMTAAATHKTVIAGPVEATVLGNIAVQLMASGEIKNLKEARQIVAASQPVETFQPEDSASWDGVYEKFQSILV